MSSYRVQLGPGFGFAQVQATVPYLDDLGERDGPFFVSASVANPAPRPQLALERLRAPFVRGTDGEARDGVGLGPAVLEHRCSLAGGRFQLAYDDTSHRFSAAVVMPGLREGATRTQVADG